MKWFVINNTQTQDYLVHDRNTMGLPPVTSAAFLITKSFW
jgi:hypothetical protein